MRVRFPPQGIMNINEAKDWVKSHGLAYFKFVRFGEDEYCFDTIDGQNHAQLAFGRENEVQTAAEIRVYQDHCVIEGHSSTLNKSYDKKDRETLPVLFEVPYERD